MFLNEDIQKFDCFFKQPNNQKRSIVIFKTKKKVQKTELIYIFTYYIGCLIITLKRIKDDKIIM